MTKKPTKESSSEFEESSSYGGKANSDSSDAYNPAMSSSDAISELVGDSSGSEPATPEESEQDWPSVSDESSIKPRRRFGKNVRNKKVTTTNINLETRSDGEIPGDAQEDLLDGIEMPEAGDSNMWTHWRRRNAQR